MAEAVYLLCAATSMVCAGLLLRAWARGRQRLLLWSSLCFVALAANNVLLFVDRVILPTTVDLSLYRSLVGLAGLVLAPFVFKGRRAAVVSALVLVGLTAILIALNLVVSTAQAGLPALAMNLIPAAVVVALLVLLFRALSAVGLARQNAQAAAWAGYYQQTYAQPGPTGYAPPAPPPPGWGDAQAWGTPQDPPPHNDQGETR